MVRLQAMAAAAAAAGRLSGPQDLTWFNPNKHETAPTAPAISENRMKNGVAAFCPAPTNSIPK